MPQVLVPILIAAATAAIGAFFQNRQANTDEQVKRTDLELAQAQALFDVLSPQMDARIFAMQRVYWAITDKHQGIDNIKTRWDTYQQTLLTWNGDLNKNASLLEGYYGKAMYAEFNDQIQAKFRVLHTQLKGFYHQNDVMPSEAAQKEFVQTIDELHETIRLFNLKMIHAKQNWNVGALRSSN